jgi:hypothetical protein
MINPNGILKGSGYTATEIVYPIKVLKIDKIYPIIVADLAFIIKICTKLVILICAIPQPINITHNKTPLVCLKNDNSSTYLPKI